MEATNVIQGVSQKYSLEGGFDIRDELMKCIKDPSEFLLYIHKAITQLRFPLSSATLSSQVMALTSIGSALSELENTLAPCRKVKKGIPILEIVGQAKVLLAPQEMNYDTVTGET